MQFSKVILFYVLDFVAAGSWNHVSRSQFQSTIEKNDMALVAFTSPWADASKALESEWASAAAKAKKPLISIDCTIESDLCSENGITSYPAIRLFKGTHQSVRYRGPRKASELLPFLDRSLNPPLSHVSPQNLTAFQTSDSHVFIAYLPSNPSSSSLKKKFTNLAAQNHLRFTFGIASPESHSSQTPSIICYKPHESAQESFSGSEDPSSLELEAWMERVTEPLIGELTRKNEMKYLKAGKSLIYIFALTSLERTHYQTILLPLAKKYHEYLTFIVIDAVEYEHMAPALGLEAGAFPGLTVRNLANGEVFPFPRGREIDEVGVEEFIRGIVEGRVRGKRHDEL